VIYRAAARGESKWVAPQLFQSSARLWPGRPLRLLCRQADLKDVPGKDSHRSCRSMIMISQVAPPMLSFAVTMGVDYDK
jgi:hypothetical protein